MICGLIFTPQIAHAQTPSGPTYIVQPGDTLNEIALKFDVTVQDLIDTNNIQNPNLISAGTQLIIPGLEGITGILTSKIVLLGENLRSLSDAYKIPIDRFVRLNKITSPTELFLGSSIIIPVNDASEMTGSYTSLAGESTILDISSVNRSTPWRYALDNQSKNTWDFISGDYLFSPSDSRLTSDALISPLIESIEINPLPIIQGATVVIRVKTTEPLELSGFLNGKDLHFFSQDTNQYVALQGVHAMAPVGLAQLALHGNSGSQDFNLDQMFLLKSGGFGKDPLLIVPAETIDPAITKPEDEIVTAIVSTITKIKMWNEKWQDPVDLAANCIMSKYGNRRSYNGSDFSFFHTGVDFCLSTQSLAIHAVASGKVVYSGFLTVRGNTTIIDHGWGVFSAYFHQNDILVKEGDMVTPGQHIGDVGNTGRVTGPHLHFEVWVNGIQVQPFDWLDNIYP